MNHLGRERQTELLAVLDRYPECFSDVPGLTDVIKHSIPLVPGFKPKRLHAYRVPERLKPEVDRQIQEILDNGIVRPSHSPMASPLVCVLKGTEGCDPLPSNRHHRSCGDRLEGKGENYQVCSVQYCVQQLCTVRCTHI